MKNRHLKLLSLLALPYLLASCTSSYDCCDGYDVVDETYIHRYGMPVSQNHWIKEGQDGQVVYTMKNGVVVTKSVENGIAHGDTTYTAPHSDAIVRRQIFQQGNLEREVLYYPNEIPSEEIVYGPNESKLIHRWGEDETLRERINFEGERLVSGEFYDHKGQLESRIDEGNGEYFVRDDYGRISHRNIYADGSLNQRIYYHPNQTPKEIVPFKGNVIEGTKRTYLAGGEPHTEEEWVGNRQHGITVQYQNGEKYAEIPYLNGNKNGVERRYKDGQFLTEEITWINDRKHGPHKHYVGNTIKTDWYFEDQPVSKKQYELLLNPPPK